MAEFQDVMRQYKRMCCGGKSCSECNFYKFKESMSNNLRACLWFLKEYPVEAEALIMNWAAEHPEPVYPTWGKWFVEHGDLVDGWQNATNAAWMANTALSIFMKPIPADIAEKLGLEPKEGA